jgi:hypothetical protein
MEEHKLPDIYDEKEALDSYEVGYGKPPKQTRFQKGTSGNPSGRPKKALAFGDAVLRGKGANCRPSWRRRGRQFSRSASLHSGLRQSERV